MLSDDFDAALKRAPPGQRLTGIVTWQREAADTEDISAVDAAKQPLVDAASACAGARVNPLYGMPQLILEAPAESWRRLLAERPELLEATDVVVEANRRLFATPPDPG